MSQPSATRLLSAIATISVLATPLLRIAMLSRGHKNLPRSRRMELRGRATRKRPADAPLIWIHAVSVGESRSAIIMVRALKKFLPSNTHFLITTRTQSAAAIVAAEVDPHLIHQFAPYEQALWVRRFLRHWKPDAAMWLESELWPVVLPLAQRSCPTLLVQARLSADSWERWDTGVWGSTAHLLRALLSGFAAIFVQREDDIPLFERAGARHVAFHGNMKHVPPELGFDAQLHSFLSVLQTAVGKRMWAALSTHAPEERRLAISQFLIDESLPRSICVLVPRHPERGAAIRREIEATGLHCWLYSETEHNEEGFQAAVDHLTKVGGVLIIDQINAIGTVTALVKVVFVGGSWAKVGGHNLTEAAAAGCVVMHGPKVWNFGDLVTALHAEFAAEMLTDESALAQRIVFYLTNPEAANNKGARAQNWVKNQAALPEQLARGVLPFLPTFPAPPAIPEIE